MIMGDSGIDKIAASLLHRAVELDHKKRYTEALVLYLEALNVLMENVREDVFMTLLISNIPKNFYQIYPLVFTELRFIADTTDMTAGEKKKSLQSKISTYMDRAETLKKHVDNEKKSGKYHEQIEIANNSTGHSYNSVFGRFLDHHVTKIYVEDPYIRAYHQCQNFISACELFVKKCNNLKQVYLLTTEDSNADQKHWLEKIRCDLESRFNIALIVQYSSTLHDRQIRLNNGWVIKIGRGLDYFKAPDNKFSLGVHDLDLRPCHETVVDIFQKPPDS